MTKKAAIAHARRSVSALHPCGTGWTFYQLDHGRRAWRETNPRPYYDAAAARRAALIAAARVALDLPEIDPATMDTGRWTDAVTTPRAMTHAAALATLADLIQDAEEIDPAAIAADLQKARREFTEEEYPQDLHRARLAALAALRP